MILFHLANALYLVSYAVRDILWLRAITVLAGFAVLASLFSQPQPPRAAIAWNLVFFCINLVRIHLLVRERRPVPLGGDEQHVANLVFPNLRSRELLRLLRVGAFVDHPAGARIVTRGEPLDRLMLVVRGAARVELATKPAIDIAEGTFIGELAYLTNKPPGADVVANGPLRVVEWSTPALHAFLDKNGELKATMQQVLGVDLAAKLRRG